MTLAHPSAARSKILHVLADRPMMTTQEVIDAAGTFEFLSTSDLYTECGICEGGQHWEPGSTRIVRYSLASVAYQLLRGLERRGLVRRSSFGPGQGSVGWSLVPAEERAPL